VHQFASRTIYSMVNKWSAISASIAGVTHTLKLTSDPRTTRESPPDKKYYDSFNQPRRFEMEIRQCRWDILRSADEDANEPDTQLLRIYNSAPFWGIQIFSGIRTNDIESNAYQSTGL
jgi:hypothetical protein